jgi:hypothetical protein
MSFSISYPETYYYFPTTSYIEIICSISSPITPILFTITPDELPYGINFDKDTGNITGQANFLSIKPLTHYTVDASSNDARATTSLNISVNYTPVFFYPSTPDIFKINAPLYISPVLSIANIPGIIYSSVSSPSIESLGLNLNSNTGVISGIPDISSIPQLYTIRADNGGITYDADVNISIQTVPTVIYSQPNYILTQNVAVTITPLVIESQTQITYSIDGCNLPVGLSFNTATGEISGIPSILTTFRSYKITATNSIGFSSTNLILNVIKVFLAPPVVADNFSSDSFLSDTTISMRRKAEIFKYKKNSSCLTKQQYYALIAKGNGPSEKRAWGTQGDAYTNPNTSVLSQNGNNIVCNGNSIICSPTSSSDVPGPVMNLCYNPAIPLISYNQPNRFRTNIGFKWPQRSWQPGNNGFPIGKAGSG